MKRGLITWDRNELPPEIFHQRLEHVRGFLRARQLPALLVYTDVWRSNRARYLTNFMPYWNRSLVVIPVHDPPILLCGLSPRVYPWIRSVSILQDIRPAGRLAEQLLQLCRQNHWLRIGVLDLARLPQEIFAPLRAPELSLVDLPSEEILGTACDPSEILMRRRAAELSREILGAELAHGKGRPDSDFAGHIERALRRKGAEDLILLFAHGNSAPVPASGVTLGEDYSIALAVEYRGHWVRLARPCTSARVAQLLRQNFEAGLKNLAAPSKGVLNIRNLAGLYPYETCPASAIEPGAIISVDLELAVDGRRFFYGDTCRYGEAGANPV